MSTVTEYLADHEVDFLAFDHRRAQTAKEEARVLGLSPSDVAKVIVLRTPKGYALAVIPASRRLSMGHMVKLLGTWLVGLASEKQIAAAFPSYELGAIPPVGSLVGVPVYVDSELARHEMVTFASGRQNESVKMHVSDLVKDSKVTVADLCEPYPTYDEDWME